MRYHEVQIPLEEIGALCERRRIRRLSLFGSILRDDFRPESDVDVLVEFEPGCVPGFGFVEVQEELSRVLGRRVDLHTPASLSRHFVDQILREAEAVYVAA
jgi:predicted nucleotidyltransferase